jgi:hypothetical protein
MTEAIRELDAAELDLVGGGLTFWQGVLAGAVAAICKGATEAFVGGIATGLETGGVGFVVAAAGGIAAAGCAYGMTR